jgi:ribonuclease HIII
MKIGVDEAGKGDYFGYLVVAAVLVDEKIEKQLKEIGVKDSKLLSDFAIRKLAPRIKKICKCDIVKISPEKYNKLYGKFGSLNKLLAWGHARAIENLLKNNECELVISDRFTEKHFLAEALFERGRKVKLNQIFRAEKDMAVAAASVLARYEFLRTLRMLGREVGIVLPKGAAHVKETANTLVRKYGRNILPELAKVHFKITKQLEK